MVVVGAAEIRKVKMYYLDKRKREDGVNPLYPTYCEKEEKQYYGNQSCGNSTTQLLKFLVMGLLILFMGIFTQAEALPCKKIVHESHWDGAGDQWTCGNCGTTNYKWQMSCSNCGNSQ